MLRIDNGENTPTGIVRRGLGGALASQQQQRTGPGSYWRQGIKPRPALAPPMSPIATATSPMAGLNPETPPIVGAYTGTPDVSYGGVPGWRPAPVNPTPSLESLGGVLQGVLRQQPPPPRRPRPNRPQRPLPAGPMPSERLPGTPGLTGPSGYEKTPARPDLGATPIYNWGTFR